MEYPTWSGGSRPEISDPTPIRTRQLSTIADGNGYIRRGYHRELVNGVWRIAENRGGVHLDVYANPSIFMENSATVQVVTFSMAKYVGDNLGAVWEEPLSQPRDVKAFLRRRQRGDTWRWIHCILLPSGSARLTKVINFI